MTAADAGPGPRGPGRRRRRRTSGYERLGRLALLAGGIVLSLLVLEAVLQLAAAGVRLLGRRPVLTALSGRRRILSLGDSNTYGLYLERDQAYPNQLRRVWNARHRDAPIEVVNMGYPGNSSSQVLRHLPEMLTAAHPDVLTVMIGANDFWTEPVPTEGEAPKLRSVLWRFSRVYRLAYMLARSGDAGTVEVTMEPAAADGAARRRVRYGGMEITQVRTPVPGGVKGWEHSLVRNLTTMAAIAKAAHVDLVFLTYPSPHLSYATADAVIRRAAAETGTPLVDLAARFGKFCPQPDCRALLFDDQHPTARGHLIAAVILAESLAHRMSVAPASARIP